eukprot:2312654-Pleurochrysis_carterae.AAC.2
MSPRRCTSCYRSLSTRRRVVERRDECRHAARKKVRSCRAAIEGSGPAVACTHGESCGKSLDRHRAHRSRTKQGDTRTEYPSLLAAQTFEGGAETESWSPRPFA